MEYRDSATSYTIIGRVSASKGRWEKLEGKFSVTTMPDRLVFYIEGPSRGINLPINSVVITGSKNPGYGINIIDNSNLINGTNRWFPLGSCTLSVATGSPHILPPMARDLLGHHEPLNGRHILVTNRTQTWMGPAQMITDKLKLCLTYQVSAWVRFGSGSTGPQNFNVALSVDDQWVNGRQIEVKDGRWVEIGGSFRIEKQPAKVMGLCSRTHPLELI